MPHNRFFVRYEPCDWHGRYVYSVKSIPRFQDVREIYSSYGLTEEEVLNLAQDALEDAGKL